MNLINLILIQYVVYVSFQSKSILHLKSKVKGKDICNGDDGCIFAVKQFISTPLRTSTGIADPSNEFFELKIMLIYKNRMIFYETDQGQVFLRDNPPGKWLRTVYYTDIQLECGQDSNKLCTLKEYKQLYPSFIPLPVVVNKLKGVDIDNMCILIPIIDSTEVKFDNSVIYLCQKNTALLREHHIQRDKISRLIDSFQLIQTKDFSNALNSVVRKIGKFKTSDAGGEPVEIYMMLYFHKLLGFQDMDSLITQKFKLNLREIINGGAMTVESAKNGGKLKKADWDKAKAKNGLTGQKEKCCIFVQKKDGKNYMCLVDNEEKTCQILTMQWVKLFNAYSSKLNFLEDQDELKEGGDSIECDDPKLKTITQRLVNIADFQNEVCKEQELVLMTYSDSNCNKDREDQTAEETRILADGEKPVQDLVEKCIKSGDIQIPTK